MILYHPSHKFTGLTWRVIQFKDCNAWPTQHKNIRKGAAKPLSDNPGRGFRLWRHSANDLSSILLNIEGQLRKQWLKLKPSLFLTGRKDSVQQALDKFWNMSCSGRLQKAKINGVDGLQISDHFEKPWRSNPAQGTQIVSWHYHAFVSRRRMGCQNPKRVENISQSFRNNGYSFSTWLRRE